jgi:hypothetical protein
VTDHREYKFRIEAYTPDTLPMERLAEYMADLAKVLGEPASVHFVRLDPGSTVLVQKVDEEAEPKVRQRVQKVHSGDGPPDALLAYNRINRRLLNDDAIGTLSDDKNTTVINFPGRKLAEPVTFGAFNQVGSVDGQLIRIGGVRDLVPVTLQASDGRHFNCQAPRELAKTIARYLLGPELRVHGDGRWRRDKIGVWQLDRFTIGSFEPLGDEPLSAVVARLRDIQGSEWPEMEDPWAELERERNGPSEAH